jgi:hypothetical protein
MSTYKVHLQAAKSLYIPFPRSVRVNSIRFVTYSTFGTDGSNYFTLTVYANDAASALCTYTNNSVGGQLFTDAVPVEATLANMDKGDFSTTQVMKIVSALTGTGTIDGTLVIDVDDNRDFS